MRIRRRTLRRLVLFSRLPLLVTFAATPALSQNLLVNPGFDRDLSGWRSRVADGSSTRPTANTFVAWDAADGSGIPSSGGAGLHAKALEPNTKAAVGQCVPVAGSSLATFGARFLVRSERLSNVTVTAAFFPSGDCSGVKLLQASAPPVPSSVTVGSDSGGAWHPVQSTALAPSTSHSAFVELVAEADWTWFYGDGWADVVGDDAFLTVAPSQQVTTLLPSAAWVSGAGAYWSTRMTLVNPGTADAAVTLKWLGHDMDGRGGPERAYLVRAGQTMALSEEEWEISHPQDYGAILVTSSSPALFLQSETSTSSPGGGTVGQALPAFGPADYASATPKTLAPIRENASFRTNLVLANATEAPLTAHVALFAADGTPIGSRDVDLPPLGMTQINRVAAALGATTLDAGRIAVSTPTVGGLVAAYASIIDNVTNDPRTLLPQDATPAANRPNLLTNSGFDRDLSGWTLTLSGVDGYRSGAWDPRDANGDVRSGSTNLFASLPGVFIQTSAVLRQCVPVVPSHVYGLQAKIIWSGSGLFGARPLPGLSFSYFASSNCTGDILSRSHGAYYAASPAPLEWLVVPTDSFAAPDTAGSASVELSAESGGVAVIGAYFDDVVFSEGQSSWAPVVPAAASIEGLGGSFWTTTLTLANPTAVLATAYLYGPAQTLPAGRMLSILDVVRAMRGSSQSQTWLPLFFGTTSPAIAITAETSTPTPGGGTVGQALAAFGPRDFAGSTPKTLAPIRDNDAFRTNLVLVNVSTTDLVAHVDLFDAAGASIGSLDVPLSSGAATQIGAVGSTLSGGRVDVGRLAVSTPTPGGLVAAYASVIDNATNDPRTLLPRGGESGANLLSNAGFDRDDAGWKSTLSTLGSPAWSSSWVADDASGEADSGGLALRASSDIHDGIVALRWQCVGLSGGSRVSFGAKFRTARQSARAGSEIQVGFFPTADCGRYEDSVGGGSATSLVSPPSGDATSNGAWLPAVSSVPIPAAAHSMGFYVRAWAGGIYGGPGPSSVGYLDAVVDDVFASIVGEPPR